MGSQAEGSAVLLENPEPEALAKLSNPSLLEDTLPPNKLPPPELPNVTGELWLVDDPNNIPVLDGSTLADEVSNIEVPVSMEDLPKIELEFDEAPPNNDGALEGLGWATWPKRDEVCPPKTELEPVDAVGVVTAGDSVLALPIPPKIELDAVVAAEPPKIELDVVLSLIVDHRIMPNFVVRSFLQTS